MKKGKSNNKTSKSKIDFYWAIYHKIMMGGQISEICKEYNVKKQNLTFYINKLKHLKIIDRVDSKNTYLGFKVLVKLSRDQLFQEVKVKSKKGKSKRSLGTSRGESNLHALQLNIPILSGRIDDSDWQIKERLKNWIPKYTTLKELGGMRLKNNNNMSLTVWAKSRNIKNVDEIHSLTVSILFYLGSYFKNKHNVSLDIINSKVKNLDIATEDKNAESMRGKGEKFLLKLNKECEKILPNDDKREAKAWIDGSPFKFSAETNDIDWKREYLNMPFNIKHLIYSLPALEEYNENLKLHMEVQREQLETQRRIQEFLRQLKDKL